MLNETLAACRVLPVITAVDVPSTVALVRTLARGGMKAVEITLRTNSALDSIRAVAQEVPEVLAAAGTVTNPGELDQALDAGAKLIVSPGSTPALLSAARDRGVDLVPGVASASEVMQGLDLGYSSFKLFPAEASGGMALLKSLAGPFPDVKFCPTGGLNPDNYRNYLALDNVICCGGSWMVASDLVAAEDWATIETLAREAMTPASENGA